MPARPKGQVHPSYGPTVHDPNDSKDLMVKDLRLKDRAHCVCVGAQFLNNQVWDALGLKIARAAPVKDPCTAKESLCEGSMYCNCTRNTDNSACS